MPLINNENVSVNDEVYDVLYGYGTVIDTTFNNIVVVFPNGLQVIYDEQGRYNGVQRLEWHSKEIIRPPKDIRKWNALKKCTIALNEYLNSLEA